jgi:hypothetical protein
LICHWLMAACWLTDDRQNAIVQQQRCYFPSIAWEFSNIQLSVGVWLFSCLGHRSAAVLVSWPQECGCSRVLATVVRLFSCLGHRSAAVLVSWPQESAVLVITNDSTGSWCNVQNVKINDYVWHFLPSLPPPHTFRLYFCFLCSSYFISNSFDIFPAFSLFVSFLYASLCRCLFLFVIFSSLISFFFRPCFLPYFVDDS